MRHILTLEDVERVLDTRVLAYDTNRGQRRKLVMEVNILGPDTIVQYAVFDLNSAMTLLLLRTGDIKKAIEAYNDA